MSQLGTFTEFYNYFSELATSHVDINGFKFGDRKIVNCGARSDLTLPVLWAEGYDPVRIIDTKSDNHTGAHDCTVYILDVMPEKWEDQRIKFEEMEVIGKQIISRILKEYQDGSIQTDLNNWKYGWTEPVLGATQMIGCRMDISFMRPERLVYDESKWT